jgi:hypothetical protein
LFFLFKLQQGGANIPPAVSPISARIRTRNRGGTTRIGALPGTGVGSARGAMLSLEPEVWILVYGDVFSFFFEV